MFAKLIWDAYRANMQPVLMASHLSPQAMRFCGKVGIAAFSFGRQFLPNSLQSRVRYVFGESLSRQFQFLRPGRPFANVKTIDQRSLEDLRLLSQPTWIELARQRWLLNSERIPDIHEALTTKDFKALEYLLSLKAVA